jgi:hypothetical protein
VAAGAYLKTIEADARPCLRRGARNDALTSPYRRPRREAARSQARTRGARQAERSEALDLIESRISRGGGLGCVARLSAVLVTLVVADISSGGPTSRRSRRAIRLPDTRQTGEGRQSADGSTSADSQAAESSTGSGPWQRPPLALGWLGRVLSIFRPGTCPAPRTRGRLSRHAAQRAERPKKQLGDISNLLVAKVALAYASRLAGLHIPVRDVARDHDHDGRGALWGHTRPQRRALAAVRVHLTCGQ